MPFVQAKASLSGRISEKPTLRGSISSVKDHERYDGDYEVIPKAFEDQTLKTADKVLSKDIVVTKVPYWETSNNSNGKTVYIAKEV